MKIILCLSVLLSGCVLVSASVLPVRIGFEEIEGFVPNSPALIPATPAAAWTLSAEGVRTTNPGSGEPVYQGSLAMRVEAGRSARNREIVAWEDGYNSFSYSFINEDNPYSQGRRMSWTYVYLWDEATNNSRYIQLMTRYGNAVDQDYRIEYSITNAHGSGQHEVGYVNIARELMDNIADWNRVSMQFDFENKSFDLLLNGVRVATEIALPAAWSLSGLLGVDLYSVNTATTATGIVYYDGLEFAMIPEPAIWGSMGGLLLIVWMVRRKRVTSEK